MKLGVKIDSNLSNINIHYYSRKSKTILHLEVIRIISQKQEDVKTFCNDLNNPFPFACQRWIFILPIKLKGHMLLDYKNHEH